MARSAGTSSVLPSRLDRHLRIREFRNVFRERIAEQEAALLEQRHRRDRDDRLGHRMDAEDRIRLHRAPVAGSRAPSASK